MTDDPKDAPPELESIPGRARIVDAQGNPIDPDNPPSQPAPEATPEPEAAEAEAEPEEETETEPDEPEDEGEHGGHRARAVRRRHTRSTK